MLLSYDEDYERALESTGFWRGLPSIGFDQTIADSNEIEKSSREMPIEKMTGEYFVTTDPAEVREKLEQLCTAGFDEIEILSSSPDQGTFIEMMESEGLPL